jgi:WD40 repeat protein
MPDQPVAAGPPPFDDAAEMRRTNVALLAAMDQRLGDDSSPESEAAALREQESNIRDFLDRGAATGSLIEDVKERTACQVLLDYWSSTLSHAGIRVARSRLASFDAERLPDLSDDKCPYVGLEPFRNDAFFFGRDRAVKSLLERVSEVPLVVVQGGSGSGKSSLVMGGALPVLGSAEHVPQFRLVGPFTPGNAILENLVRAAFASNRDTRFDRVAEAETLRANPARLLDILGVETSTTPALLVVDQFEEVFTLCNEADRAALAAAIGALLQSCPACRVILTLRDEFADELGKLEPLVPALALHTRFSMKEWPMGYDELRAAVERPAALVNLHFAPGIVDDLVKSVLGQDTALPLLQFALQSLWKRRDHNRITRECYERVGSPLVALERNAEGFYNGLSPENQQEVERILLELVRIDRMMEAYREPRMRSTLLASGNPRTSEMLELLARKDFLRIASTVDRDATVEVKHEALLRNWPRYVEWIGGKREGVRQRLALTEAAQRWDARGRSPTTDLLSPWQLHDARFLTGLNELEQHYVQASEEHADADRRARDWDKQIKYALAAFTAVVLVVLLDSMLLLVRSQTDRDRLQVLEQFARATEASYRGQIDDALTGALQAGFNMAALPDKMRAGLRPQLREVLLSTLQNATNLKRLFIQDDGTARDDATFNAVAFHPTRPDKLIAFGGSNGLIYLASLADAGKPAPSTLKACVDDQGVSSLSFERQGRLLVVGCRGGKLSVWSAEDWHPIGSQQVSPNFIRSLSIRQDGRLVAATAGTKIALVQLDEHGDPSKQPVTFTRGKQPLGGAGAAQTVAFSPQGDRLVAGDAEGYVLVCRPDGLKSWDCAYPQGYEPVANDAILTLAYSPNGDRIAVGHYWRGAVDIWDAQFSPGSRRTINHPSPSAVYGLAFFEACGRWQLAIGTSTGLAYSPVGPLEAEPIEFCARARWAQIGDPTYSVAFRDGRLAAATQAGYVAVLDPTSGEDPLRTRVPRADPANRDPIRGALVADAESAAWVALQHVPTEADPSNVAIWKLSEGHANNVLTFPSGKGEITRLSANAQTPRLATIGCTPLPSATVCSDDDSFEVTVSQFADRVDARPTKIVSLATTPDLMGKVPLRAVLSPNGQWLAISFKAKASSPEPRLLLVGLDDPSKRTWVGSNLKVIKEIAFSEDSKIFAAGGCCSTESGFDQVQLWSVDKSGFMPKETPTPLTLTRLAQGVQDLAFASDEEGHSILLVGGRFGAVDLWVLDTGNAPRELRVDTRGTSFVAFSREEWLVAVASSQGVVRLWDTSRWPPFELTPPVDDPAPPGFLAFTGNGARLISSADKTDFWDLDPVSLQRKVCALLRQVDPDGINGDRPWHQNKECKEGALTPPPRSFLERIRDSLKRAWAALRFADGTN